MLGGSIRAPLSVMALLIELVQLPSFLSDPRIRRSSAAAAADVLLSAFQMFPTSAFFLWNAGRSERMRWNLGLADALFTECGRLAAASDSFKALANVSAYDRAFCFLFLAPANNALAKALLAPPTSPPAYLQSTPLGDRLANPSKANLSAVPPVAPSEAAGGAAAAPSVNAVTGAVKCGAANYDWSLCPVEELRSGRHQSCWHLAETQFEFLQESDLWSRAFFSYMAAICRAERGHMASAAAQFDVVQQQLGRKLAGKRISAEQFIVRKTDVWRRSLAAGHAVVHSCRADAGLERHGSQAPSVPSQGAPRYLMLPGLEVMYLFNGFSCMHPAVARAALFDVDDALLQLAGAELPLLPPAPGAPTGAVRERYCFAVGIPPPHVTALLDATFVGVFPDLLRTHISAAAYTGLSEAAAAVARGDTGRSEVPDSAPAAAEAVAGGVLKKRAPLKSLPHPAEATHASGTPRVDLVAVGALLRGVALGSAGDTAGALACLQWVVEHKDAIKEDNYTVPFAFYEMATLLGPTPEGAALAQKAKDYSTDYNFKMRLHLRLHLLGQAFKRSKEAKAQ
jgi:hypothetical protein